MAGKRQPIPHRQSRQNIKKGVWANWQPIPLFVHRFKKSVAVVVVLERAVNVHANIFSLLFVQLA